jgi:hypothetical protein
VTLTLEQRWTASGARRPAYLSHDPVGDGNMCPCLRRRYAVCAPLAALVSYLVTAIVSSAIVWAGAAARARRHPALPLRRPCWCMDSVHEGAMARKCERAALAQTPTSTRAGPPPSRPSTCLPTPPPPTGRSGSPAARPAVAMPPSCRHGRRAGGQAVPTRPAHPTRDVFTLLYAQVAVQKQTGAAWD